MTNVDNDKISVGICSRGTDTTAITEAWFSRDQVGGSSGSYDRVYAVHCTTCLNYPKFPTLIEYNTFDSNCIQVAQNNTYANPVECGRYIGESINIGDVALTKVIFPCVLKQMGYNSMLLYSGNPSDPAWYCSPHSVSCMQSTDYVYNIYLESNMRRDLDTVVQFTSLANGSLEPYDVMSCLHTSNYSNPHTDQVSHIGSSDNYGYMSTMSRYAALTSPFNGIIVGNTLINNDYSTRYLGDQVLLIPPEYIASNGYYICMSCCGSIMPSEIVYPGRYYSYRVLAGPLSASSLDPTASVAGIRRCTGSYIDGHWDDWGDSCRGIDLSSFFNAADGHLYTCVYLTDMSISQINLRFSAIENEQVYCDYAICVGIYTPTYTTLTFSDTVKDPVALRSPKNSSSTISGGNTEWDVSECTDLTYYTEQGGSIIANASVATICYCADLCQSSGGFCTTNKSTGNVCECTDVIHAIPTYSLNDNDSEATLSSVYSNPNQFNNGRGIYELITMCSCVGIECSEQDPETGCIETNVCYVCSNTPALGFTVAPTGMLYCDVEHNKRLEYALGQSIDVCWITIPYLTPTGQYIGCKCQSFVWDTCRDASPYLCESIVYGVLDSEPDNCYCLEHVSDTAVRTQFFNIEQCTETLPETSTTRYFECGTLTLTCAFDENYHCVDRPYLIRDMSVLGGWKYPDALCIVNRAPVEVNANCVQPQRININTYYCCAYFSVPEGSSLKSNGDGSYYLEGDTICVGKDVIINTTPYGANHNVATLCTCGPDLLPQALCYNPDEATGVCKWDKTEQGYAREYLVEHPAQLYVSYPANGCACDSSDYRLTDAYLNVYLCYDVGALTLMSYVDPTDAQSNISLGTDGEGRQFITYKAPSGTTSWDATKLIHWTPASATIGLCYAVDPEESLNDSISVSNLGVVCLTLGEDDMPTTYGLGAVTITAAQCSTGNVISKKLYMCIQEADPEPLHSVTFPDLPSGITITDLSPEDTSQLRSGTEVSFRIQNTTEQQIESVTANNDTLTDTDGLYTVTVGDENIVITVTLV